ncbi:MAG TPA: hypothetical protein VN108_06335, partial [Marmoricola sp.]|nr:hypothetical protein [Marmoricola sp.]
MSQRRALSRILLSLAVASTVTTGLVIGGTEVSASALTNTPYSGLDACPINSSAISPACLSGALNDFKAARKKEGLGAMKLPANFRSMSVPMQVFTLTNIDRRDRGLPPFAALAPSLNPYTQSAANAYRDPNFPRWTTDGGGNWAGTKNSLWAEYLWMYDDGWRPGGGSTNSDCK